MATLFWEDYPANYDDIDFGMKMRILVRFKTNDFSDYSAMCRFQNRLREDEGIYVEYGWVGHRDEWFLATAYDAMMQEDYLASCD